jgi:hypothetical protein
MKACILEYQLHRVVHSPNSFRDEIKEFCLYHGLCHRGKFCSYTTKTQAKVPSLHLHKVQFKIQHKTGKSDSGMEIVESDSCSINKYLSVSRQVNSLFQTEFSKECDLELPPSYQEKNPGHITNTHLIKIITMELGELVLT